MNHIDVIILAGGKGTRLQRILPHIPKPLAPIKGRPFLDIVLLQIKKFSCISKIILAVSHKAELIVERYKNQNSNIPIVFSFEREPLGTGGAIKKALQFTCTENILCMNGDSFVEVNLDDLVRRHIQKNASMTIVVKKIEKTDRYGFVKLDGNHRIVSFEEKSKAVSQGYINTGVYIFKRNIFDTVRENQVISLEKEAGRIWLCSSREIYRHRCT
jgi:D-glycero-alpha-D-manno-heptose 1-phosphate guanylyltransferase